MPPELKTKSDVSIVLIFFTALAVLGVAGGGFVVRDYARARASLAWPTVEGIVLSQLDGETARLRYVYSFDGRSHESTRTRNFLAWFQKTESIKHYPGETVIVYVNPAEPAYSVIYPGGSSVAFVALSLMAGGAIFFGVGGVVWTVSRANAQEFAFAETPA